jgi:hypothetical protein
MTVDFKNEHQEASVTSLVSGIIKDAQDLLKQQFELLKHEVREDIRKTRDASLVMGIGIGCGLVGAILLGLMLAHLLAWAVPTLPLWVCYGICGVVVAGIGGLCWYLGIQQLETVNPLPKETTQTLKENIQWITNPK